MKRIVKLSAGACVSLLLSTGGAMADFKEDCVAAMKEQGRPGFLVGGVCKCIAEETAERVDLREEFLAKAKLPRDEQEAAISDDLKAIRDDCRPL